jgi:hypothetical protein
MNAPARLAVQCSSNPATYLRLVFRGRNENRPEVSAVDLIVMWPAARAIMFPMAAERDRDRRADCCRVGALGKHDLRMMGICPGVHPGSVHRDSRAKELSYLANNQLMTAEIDTNGHSIEIGRVQPASFSSLYQSPYWPACSTRATCNGLMATGNAR